MSQSTDYGSSDIDQLVVDVHDGNVIIITSVIPEASIADALLLESSQGSDYLPPLEDRDSQTSYVSLGALSDGVDSIQLHEPRELTGQEVDQAKVDALRARCQSVHSDKTSRRSTHEDGQALASSILSKINTVPDGWCRLSTAAPTSDKGYSQVSGGGVNKFATLQELVLWAGGGAKPAYSGRTDPNDVSHLCDRPACTIPSHVMVEPREANNRRKGCVMAVPCSRKCRECNGSKDLFICPAQAELCTLSWWVQVV
jgi:Zinc-binding loop region of homing endonuclease